MNAQTRIYLSYAKEDRPQVEEIYRRLTDLGFDVWMWDKNILAGQDWQIEVETAIFESNYFLALLSDHTAGRQGYFQKELTFALKTLYSSPNKAFNRVFVIPVRLEECEAPRELQHLVWVDLFGPNGWPQLLKVLGRPDIAELTHPEPPDDLIQACRSKNCVLYAGAGLSAEVGFPLWAEFVSEMIKWAESKNISSRSIKSLRDAASAREFDLAADSIVAEMERENSLPKLHAYLVSIFGKPAPLTQRHLLLRELPFSATMTTNFDTLLEQTFNTDLVFTPKDTEKLLELSSKREFFIAKLYGSLNLPESLIVSPAQYKDAISGNRRFAEFIESIFVSRTLIFLGSSLDGISAYLEGIRFRGGEQKHYALVAVSGSAWEAKADMVRRRYGIEVLPYLGTERHAAFDEFLQTLVARVRPATTTTTTTGAPLDDRPAVSRLRRVVLENIGPFPRLELDLTDDWNILLGDNGVGKSTILKAIAVAMCGRDALSFAERIVRKGISDDEHAQITLETDNGRRFVTDIFKTSSGYEIESIPRRCLDTEGWLALGFPPIRTMTWSKSTGPQGEQSKQRSTTTDLLPLVSGEPDPRLDEVKQWIINLDYWKAKAASGGNTQDADHYQQLQQTLFDVMGKVTGGMTLKLHGVTKDWDVSVETDDGPVPIAAISQGTAAVIGWTGVLLKRLFAVFDQTADPRSEHAIVLIDEIDAHMHPSWQQSLVFNLSEMFPNVQFIATTHSPLIIGGLSQKQVKRFARDETGHVVKLDVPEDMTMGRADQILTGRLFGLQTTLDRTTQNKIARMQQLVGKNERTNDEETELQQLRAELDVRIPVPSEETPVYRRAQELLQGLIQEQVGGNYPSAKKSLLDRARDLFDELEHERIGEKKK